MGFVNRRYKISVIANYDRRIFSFDTTMFGFWCIRQMCCRIVARQREYHVRYVPGYDRARTLQVLKDLCFIIAIFFVKPLCDER